MKAKKWIHLVWALLAMAVASGGALAADGMVTGITVSPMNPKPNEAITVTVQGTVTTAGKKCTILFLKGDGTAQSQVGQAGFPLTFGGQPYPLYVYSQPGTYTIKVYPSPNQLDAKCTGSAQVTIKVSDPQPLGGIKINPGMVATALGPDPCPQGWHKVSGKADGPFTCQPNKPIQKIQCPPKTQYFETECAIGCQQVIY